MKTVYSALATLALLLSMPALASNLAEKATGTPGDKVPKESKSSTQRDKIVVSDGGHIRGTEHPICFGGG